MAFLKWRGENDLIEKNLSIIKLDAQNNDVLINEEKVVFSVVGVNCAKKKT